MNSSGFEQVEIQRRMPAHLQIAERLRGMIKSGEMAAGSRLPTTQEFARLWNTHVPTVHLALTILTKEGLLDRLHRKGTFVRQTGNRLSTIGVYYSSDIWATDWKEAEYHRHVYRHLKEILNEHKIKERVFHDVRPADEQTSPWPLLEKAVNEREIQGLLILMMDMHQAKWLPHQPIPTIGLTGLISSRVEYDIKQFIEAGIQSLVDKGCRSLGLITPISKDDKSYKIFQRVIRKLGLETRDEWIRTSSECVRNQEQYGYEQFRSLWSQQNRPDGVIVLPDNVAKGVITAVLQEKIRVPEELCLVLHRNKELEYICPFPVTFMESSCRIIAEKLWEQLQHQLQGGQPKPLQLNFSQVENMGVREFENAQVRKFLN
ncbi:MAG: GntR family transcriptional regulator [Victivallales bacterium]